MTCCLADSNVIKDAQLSFKDDAFAQAQRCQTNKHISLNHISQLKNRHACTRPSHERDRPNSASRLGLAGLGCPAVPCLALPRPASQLDLAGLGWAALVRLGSSASCLAAPCLSAGFGWARLGLVGLATAPCLPASLRRTLPCHAATPCLSAGLGWARLGWAWHVVGSARLGLLGWARQPRRALPRPATPCLSAGFGWARLGLVGLGNPAALA